MARHSSMYDQVSNLRPNIRTNHRNHNDGIKDPSTSPMNLGDDGEDHINIWEHAETELGKVLSHNSNISLNHDIFKHFDNMGAFWHYIQSEERDDRIRTMSGDTLKKFSKKLTPARVTNFRAIILDANWQRIKKHKAIIDALRESNLPFECYYIDSNNGIRIRPGFFKWLLRGFEEIRMAVKEDRAPNFEFLLDDPRSGIYDYVIPKSMKDFLEKKKLKESQPKSKVDPLATSKFKDILNQPESTTQEAALLQATPASSESSDVSTNSASEDEKVDKDEDEPQVTPTESPVSESVSEEMSDPS